MPVGGPEICVLSNPRSGTSLRNPGAVERAMRAVGPRAQLRSFSGDPADEATRALQDGFQIIVAVGGDGSVSGVAHALAGSDTPLAILPMGRGRRGRAGHSGWVGARHRGRNHEQPVVLNLPIGLYPAILEEREATRKLIRRHVDLGRDVLVSTQRRIAVTVRGRRRILVALDGEKLKMRLPLRIKLAYHQLQVVVPPAHPVAGKTP